MRSTLAVAFVLWSLAACQASRGTLLLVGGGLDDDARSVYATFVASAAAAGPARLVVMTAATGPQDAEATDKSEALRVFAPQVPVAVVRRETDTAATVAAIDVATGLFFTGGDQQRVLDRYCPGGVAGPEWHAMQRLLARGGVIAGASAGCAMMGERMLLGGRSAAALGVPPKDGDPAVVLGPRVGPGMAFLPGVLTDSHFFERDRVGRLVAGVLHGPDRLAVGVGEDAAVRIDLAQGLAFGVTDSESLWLDASHARRVGPRITGLRARLIERGQALALAPLGSEPPRALPDTNAHVVPIVEPGQNRQLASWRVFRLAWGQPGVFELPLDGHRLRVQRVGDVLEFEIVLDA